MRLTGVIFDCDGTLVDSMGMWRDATAWLLAAFDGPEVPFEEVEALSLPDTCQMFYERYGMGSSAEELYEAICAHVRGAYEKTSLLPGAAEFVRSLAKEGIPLAIATSTPVREVRHALAHHGLESYFTHVVSTEDVGGVDKEFPDVYLEALRRLGGDPATTWVFEDAPFGARSASRAGFPVVGIYNAHDGRAREEVAAWCDAFIYSWHELPLARFFDLEKRTTNTQPAGTCKVLVVGGSPEKSTPELIANLAAQTDYCIAADAGVNRCHAAHVVPDVVVGDKDSAQEQALLWAQEQGAVVITLPREKNETDLALALLCAQNEAVRRKQNLALTLTSVSGGRPDHALGVLGVLAAQAQAAPQIVEATFEARILAQEGCPTWELSQTAQGRTLSLIALSPQARVSTQGLHWNLESESLELLNDRGVSNLVDRPTAAITCESGILTAFLLKE